MPAIFFRCQKSSAETRPSAEIHLGLPTKETSDRTASNYSSRPRNKRRLIATLQLFLGLFGFGPETTPKAHDKTSPVPSNARRGPLMLSKNMAELDTVSPVVWPKWCYSSKSHPFHIVLLLFHCGIMSITPHNQQVTNRTVPETSVATLRVLGLLSMLLDSSEHLFLVNPGRPFADIPSARNGSL